MLRKGLRAGGASPASARGLLRERRQLVEAEVEAGDRAGQVGRAVHEPSVQRIRVLDVLLDHVVVELLRREVAAPRRDDPAALDRVLALLPQRHQLVVELELRERKRGGQAHGLDRDLACPLERLDERGQLTMRRSAVEPADADVDRMDLTAADDRHHLVAGLLQLEALADELADGRAPSSSAPS